MEISIIITNYNGISIIKETLPTIVDAATQDPDNYYEILFIDDCSVDNSIQYVKENYPDVKIRKTVENSGYMHANNFGVNNARFPLVFCVNNDMKILPGTIRELAKHFQDEKVFAASGKIYDWNKNFLYGNRGGEFGEKEKGYFSYFEKNENDTTTQSLFACGGAFLCRKDIYLSLGGYDAELFSPYYYDETDLCFRALKKEWKIIYETKSVAYHKVAGTASKQYEDSKIKVISARNNYLFAIKNIHDKDMTKQMLIYIPLSLLKDIFKLKFRFVKAFYQVIKMWKFISKKRKEEIKKGGLTAKEIFTKVKPANENKIYKS